MNTSLIRALLVGAVLVTHAAPAAAQPPFRLLGAACTSAWAQKYGCGARVKKDDIVDDKPGYVHDGGRQNPGSKSWGLLPRPGRAEVYAYPGCRDGKVVADVVRIDKGHTEGLEPRVTEELVKAMLSGRGGKIATMQ